MSGKSLPIFCPALTKKSSIEAPLGSPPLVRTYCRLCGDDLLHIYSDRFIVCYLCKAKQVVIYRNEQLARDAYREDMTLSNHGRLFPGAPYSERGSSDFLYEPDNVD